MSKRIAYCADGTWDSSSNNSNVYRLFKSILTTADQVAYYDDGVGADGLPLEKLVGGAFGTGLFQKIKDGYSKISQVYEADDELFVFGFSRGAYTARSLAGMIAICGLPTKDFDDNLVETAFQAYRNKDQRTQLLSTLGKYGMYDAKLTMVGVWDTVGALGIPAVFGAVSPLIYGFLDTSLHPDVLNAYHALAIDERRAAFPPTLWTSQNPGQTLEQVWFCGVHSDVGGGYAADADGTALSDLTLGWMIDKASDLGLVIDPGVESKYSIPLDPEDALDQLHESWNPLWGFPRRRTITGSATLSNSVLVRCETDASYRPQNLQFSNGTLAGQYAMAPVVSVPAALTAAASAGGTSSR
jgi:uncharacterized protein (DUF2235 family)